MLQLELEVRIIYFFINTMTESCSIQFIHNQSSTHLKSKLKSKCRDYQEINEKIDLNIQYIEKGYLKLQIYDEQIIFGEATINLGFYIENNLPAVIDNITIQNKYDQEAYVELSLAWNQLEQMQTQEIQSSNPLREQQLLMKLTQQTRNSVQGLKMEDQIESQNTNYSSVGQNLIIPEFNQEQFDKKSIENRKNQQFEDEKIEDIFSIHLQTTKSQKFQTIKDCKFTKKQATQKSSGFLEKYKSQVNNKYSQSDYKSTFKELGQQIQQKSSNIFDQRMKIKIENQLAEQNKKAAKSKLLGKQTEDIEKQDLSIQEAGFFSSRKFELEKGYKDTSIQQLQNENKQLKNQIQALQLENQGLNESLIQSETTFNFLSETYTALRNEYKKIQLKIYDDSNNNFILNQEYDYLKKELDQKQKEIEFIQKESQLWKIESDIIKRENLQLQTDLEQFKKEVFNKQIENINLQRDIERQKIQINALEQQLQNQKLEIQQFYKECEQIIDGTEIKNQNEELKQIKQKNGVLEERENQKQEFLDEVDKMSPLLQLDVQMLKKQLSESISEIKSKTLENEKLKSQINIFLQQPNQSNLDFTYLINEYLILNANLKQENESLIHQNKKDQVKLDSLQKQLNINKNIIELSEKRQKSLEQEILSLEKDVLSGKQNMADVINAVLDCGGPDLAEAVERFLITRRSTKIS
ncbi:unnamed protein product [Paramecium sonneborni]|uniref:Uncharacterized protein n=1 Tax=Paramecium sonneborni TaxID=65129 RepID=A0A8S1QR77_9CILI|nr:unnamed protein product [Paramecium sonneborni]